MSPSASAVMSDDGVYRYRLHRRWAEGMALGWIMLNPSTADHAADDPTIRRCIGFAKREGYGALVVVNLYALRATDPRALVGHPDPVGPENDRHMRHALGMGPLVAAWGARAPARAAEVLDGLFANVPLLCLGTTKDGHPRHPLYVRGDAPLVPFGRT